MKFDDLSIDQRVTPVDDIKQSLKEEMPYLLFYQIVPVIEVAASSADSTETKPPSYDDTTLNIALSEASGQTGRSQDRPSMSRQASSCFESLSALPSTNASVRFSRTWSHRRGQALRTRMGTSACRGGTVSP